MNTAHNGNAKGNRIKPSKIILAMAVFALAAAGLEIASLIETIIDTLTAGKDLYLDWLVIFAVLFASLYLLLGLLVLKRKGFALGITVTAICIFPVLATDIVSISSGQNILMFRLLPQIALVLDIALFILLLVNRRQFIHSSREEAENRAEAGGNRGIIAAGILAFLGGLLQILVSVMYWEFGMMDTPSAVFGVIGILYLLACGFILGRSKAGLVLGLIASPIAFLSGFALMGAPFLLIPNTVFAVAVFALLIFNRRKFGKRQGPLIKPVYDPDTVAFEDCRYHYRRGDIRHGYAKKAK